jgi:hypothetical protein
LASAIAGQLIITAAEVIWPSNRDLGDVLFSVSPILTGAGLVTAGVAIIRAGALDHRGLGHAVVRAQQPASCASPQRRSERPGNGKDHRSYLTAHPLIGMSVHS